MENLEVLVNCYWYGGKGEGAVTVPRPCSLSSFKHLASLQLKLDSEFSDAKAYLPTYDQLVSCDYEPSALTPEQILSFKRWKSFEQVELDREAVVIFLCKSSSCDFPTVSETDY